MPADWESGIDAAMLRFSPPTPTKNYAWCWTTTNPQAREINAWLEKNPRITLHFTPTSGSWLNLVEVFFGIITRQAIRRGTFANVPQLVTAIGTFIDGRNDRCHPFLWTKTADEILPHARRQPTSDARH